MSDDLISRKEALERLRLLKRLNTTEAIQIVISVAEQQINNCKTAFDKEKVLKELAFLKKDAVRHEKNDFADAYELAIEVVKKGGIE